MLEIKGSETNIAHQKNYSKLGNKQKILKIILSTW